MVEFSNVSKNADEGRVTVSGSVGSNFEINDITTKEIILGENILNPSVQTAVTFNRFLYGPMQSLDSMKGETLDMSLSSSLTSSYGASSLNMRVNNTVYRLDNRRLISQSPSSIEEFTIHACDQSLLEDAKHLMSKSWKCATPNEIVNAALECVKASAREVSQCEPQRDYIAENIHPFRVIAQQANAALDGDDPSFVHYMTYGLGGDGIHKFKSLKSLINGQTVKTFYYSDGGEGESQSSTTPANPYPIMITFPCDFDYLTDLLNGVSSSGQNINTGTFFNIINMGMNAFGMGGASGALQGMSGGLQECFEGGNMKQSWTNKGNSHEDYGCETEVEKYLLKRQARMALLDRDKIALRMVCTWNPFIHVGDIIELQWENKYRGGQVYGSGKYLVTSLIHKIQLGGYSTTTYDCVSKDVLQGVMN